MTTLDKLEAAALTDLNAASQPGPEPDTPPVPQQSVAARADAGPNGSPTTRILAAAVSATAAGSLVGQGAPSRPSSFSTQPQWPGLGGDGNANAAGPFALQGQQPGGVNQQGRHSSRLPPLKSVSVQHMRQSHSAGGNTRLTQNRCLRFAAAAHFGCRPVVSPHRTTAACAYGSRY